MAVAYNASLDQKYAIPIGHRLGMVTGTFTATSSGSSDLSAYFKTLHQVIMSDTYADASNDTLYIGHYSSGLTVYKAVESTSTLGVATVAAASVASGFSIPFVAFGLL
jgi:hypothetical protein